MQPAAVESAKQQAARKTQEFVKSLKAEFLLDWHAWNVYCDGIDCTKEPWNFSAEEVKGDMAMVMFTKDKYKDFDFSTMISRDHPSFSAVGRVHFF